MLAIDLEAENNQLRAEVQALERRLEAQERIAREQAARLESFVAELTAQTRVLHATLNAIADGVVVCNREGTITHVNPAGEELMGHGKTTAPPDQWSQVYGVFGPDTVTPFPAAELPLVRALRGEMIDKVELFLRSEKRPEGVWAEASARPIRDDAGDNCGAVVVFRDINDRKRWEREIEAQLLREKEKNDTLERLRFAVQELSTPILEVWDDVLALPVIGVVDSRRSAEMMERLLQEVEEKQCRFVIIDITGVEVVDSATADRLLKLVAAVEIVGARCILTGARGAVAQTLVSLGAGLGSLLTLRNLKQGLGECLRLMEDRGRPLERSRASLSRKSVSFR